MAIYLGGRGTWGVQSLRGAMRAEVMKGFRGGLAAVCVDLSCPQGWLRPVPSGWSVRRYNLRTVLQSISGVVSFPLPCSSWSEKRWQPLYLEHVTAVSAFSRQPLIRRLGSSAENPPRAHVPWASPLSIWISAAQDQLWMRLSGRWVVSGLLSTFKN